MGKKLEWISVEDKLPEEKVSILIYADGKVYPGYYQEGNFYEKIWTFNSAIRTDVTHWCISPGVSMNDFAITPPGKEYIEFILDEQCRNNLQIAIQKFRDIYPGNDMNLQNVYINEDGQLVFVVEKPVMIRRI